MSSDITAHYSFGGLRSRIEAGLAQIAGPVTVDVLGAVDEFHVGGRPATAHLIEQLELGPDDHVLDIGSGLGGTARFIASTTRARVTGVDLTREYVEVARWLSDLVELGELCEFSHGSAQDISSLDTTFTSATMVHVGMNIDDKRSVFASVAASLAPGARFAIYDIMKIGDGSPAFPMPWAATQATSAVESADAYRMYLEGCGFEVDASQDRTEAALAAFEALAAAAGSQGPPPLGLHLVMGPTTATKIGHLTTAIRNGDLAPVEIIARLPA